MLCSATIERVQFPYAFRLAATSSLEPTMSAARMRITRPARLREIAAAAGGDHIVAADTPHQELPGVPPGARVVFQGAPILALSPVTNNLTASARLLQHGLVRDRYFFTLPAGLWNEVRRRVGVDTFDAETTALEEELGALCGDHSGAVGLWRGRAVAYALLRRPSLPRPSRADLGVNVTQAQLDLRLDRAEERSGGLAVHARGYLGWLSLHPPFLDEHDALLEAHEKVVARWGTADFGLPVPPHAVEAAPAAEQAAFRAADARFVEFFCRWRLQGLAAPYLPIPLRPLLAGQMPPVVLQRHLQTGGLFVVPDTFPVPSRDEFRGLLDDALHSSPPDHLADWMRIIAAHNTAKQAISRFARLFELQHYWRTLQGRHAPVLRRRTTVLKEALASFLRVDENAIHRDLMEIRKRLGADWVERGTGGRLGPF
ncbi:MAG: hypothetical protein C0483_23710 [Pirellula sp.]|nr:hypothetical protein [Pirellula sp.]